MKNILILLLFINLIYFPSLIGQQNYCNFEGIKNIGFGLYSGHLDSLLFNPSQDSVNSSTYCARYIRDTSLYDNIRIYPYEKLVNITPYLNNTFQTPKIKMKMFTTAPVGTKVVLQLGSKNDDNYPSGVHSEYIAANAVQNEWELITFHYLPSQQVSNIAPYDIDKIVLLFNPNSNAKDTFYFDDLTGPELQLASIAVHEEIFPIKLYQNIPNPAKETTNIKFQIYSSGFVSLKLYDFIGNEIVSIAEGQLKAGTYSIPLETRNISEGIYFYTLKKDGISRSMKMIISKY